MVRQIVFVAPIFKVVDATICGEVFKTISSIQKRKVRIKFWFSYPFASLLFDFVLGWNNNNVHSLLLKLIVGNYINISISSRLTCNSTPLKDEDKVRSLNLSSQHCSD